jgi:tetratricopeptide (TPR) repeat protein
MLQLHVAACSRIRRVLAISSLALLSGVLAVTSVRPGCAQDRRTSSMSAADQLTLQRALDAYDAGDFHAAEPMLFGLVKRYPDSFEANEALGSLYAETADLALAVRYLRHACTLAPGQAISHANLGAVYLKLKRNQEAASELRTASKLDGRNSSVQSNLGRALMLIAQPAEAAKAFAAAVTLQPDNGELRYNLALALFDSGAIAQAGDAFRQIPAQPASDQTEALGGDISEKLGVYHQAVLHYQAAAQLNPSDSNLYALAVEFLRHWTWDEAAKIASYGTSRYPKSTHFRLAEGIAHYGSGRYSESASIFSSLLAQDPDSVLYADLLGRSCGLIAEDSNSGCMGLKDFAYRHPKNARAAVYAATSILHRPAAEQDTGEVAKLLNQAIAVDPRLAEAYFQMAVLEQSRLQWKESAENLRKSIELQPSYPEAHYRLSRAFAHMGMRDEAQQQMALQQKYSQQEKEQVNAHLQEVVTFLLQSN